MTLCPMIWREIWCKVGGMDVCKYDRWEVGGLVEVEVEAEDLQVDHYKGGLGVMVYLDVVGFGLQRRMSNLK